ncbi:hypothetical protein FBU30_001423 [Linnemannia zychae]|nr:hypothetical protein FBU30_001423 [Linnemannia zychae]
MDHRTNSSLDGKNVNNPGNNINANATVNNNTNSSNATEDTTIARSITNTDKTGNKGLSVESSRIPSQQTPKALTTTRVKTTPTSQGTTPTTPTSSLPSPHSIHGSRGVSANNTPKDKQSKHDEAESTTPVYPDSTTLLNRSASNAKIQLSDIQPIETKTVDRIKYLEISIEQHRASQRQLDQLLDSLQEDVANVKRKHEAALQATDARTRELKSSMDQLQETSLTNSGRLQELWELVRQLSEDLADKESQLIETQNRIDDLKQSREEILQDREETEREPLEIIRMEKAKLLVEYEEIQEIEQSCVEIMEELKKTFSTEEIESKRAKVMENDERIAQLESTIADNKRSTMIDERNADELVLMFEKVFERRIRSHAQEFETIEQQAMKIEKLRDHEANAALEEYIRLNQLAVEAEENASREEFKLLAEREKLAELETSLRDLRLKLNQLTE